MTVLINILGQRIVVLPQIIFSNKQNIPWKEVERYLLRYIGTSAILTESQNIIHIEKSFPDEYAGSNYTRSLRGSRAKAKANAVQCIHELIEIANEECYLENHKEKHKSTAANGWYYYRTRFAVPITVSTSSASDYSVYSARLVVNCSANGKRYLYDMVDIKKEARNPFKTNSSQKV